MKLHEPSETPVPIGRYVLIYVPGRPWVDGDDQGGCFWKVAIRRAPGRRMHEFGPGSFDMDEVVLWSELPREGAAT